MALFGTWAPGNFHDRLLSPLLSVLQEGAFRVTGAGLEQARSISVTFGLLTLLVFWLGLRRAAGPRAAWFGVLFLGLMPPVVLYNRMALQETPATFFLVLAACLACYGWPSETGGTPMLPTARGWIWLAGAGACAAIAVTVKATAVIALPAFVIGALAVDRAQRRAAIGAVCGGMAIVFVVYAVVWYLPNHAELSRMGAYYASHQYRPHSAMSLWLNVRRGFVGDSGGALRGLAPYLLVNATVPFSLAVATILRIKRREPIELILYLWLLCGFIFCLLSSYAPSRYYVLFFPALAGLAAIHLSGIQKTDRSIITGVFLLSSWFWLVLGLVRAPTNRLDAASSMWGNLPMGSVVVGDFAPELCLNTKFKAAPVQPGLSNDDHPVERLHATHIAVTHAPVWENWWRRRYPTIITPKHKVLTVFVGDENDYEVWLYSVAEPAR
jgi:4-amino-4-deoxy-L-arabinose transferase-like glycosyltransferase